MGMDGARTANAGRSQQKAAPAAQSEEEQGKSVHAKPARSSYILKGTIKAVCEEQRKARSVKTDWAEVYRASYRQLVRFLHRKVWDDERAQDLAQETFVRAIGTNPDNPRAWLFQVAANLARDEARLVIRRKRHLTLLRVESEVKGESSNEDPAAEWEKKEAALRLRSALDELSERDRDVLLLWDAGLDYEEIAKETGLSRGAVGTTLARAKKKLVDAHDALEGNDAAHG